MRGSLVIIAALCVVAVAEASSVRFVSVDEGQNGKDKAHRNEASEGTDAVIKKKVEEVVKKINDGEEQLEKTVKNLDVERSSTGDKESAGEGVVKKAASSEKSKVHKRDVMRALEQLAKRGMKRAEAEEMNILNARKIIIKYLSLQKAVTSKIISGLILAVDRLETDQNEKETLVSALKTFQKDIEQTYDNAISGLLQRPYLSKRSKFMRSDDIPALMTAMNQRNPLALVPLLIRLISGITNVASIAEVATNIANSRSDIPDVASLAEMIQRLLATGSFPAMADNF